MVEGGEALDYFSSIDQAVSALEHMGSSKPEKEVRTDTHDPILPPILHRKAIEPAPPSEHKARN